LIIGFYVFMADGQGEKMKNASSGSVFFLLSLFVVPVALRLASLVY
jgi:hypothetical protein